MQPAAPADGRDITHILDPMGRSSQPPTMTTLGRGRLRVVAGPTERLSCPGPLYACSCSAAALLRPFEVSA